MIKFHINGFRFNVGSFSAFDADFVLDLSEPSVREAAYNNDPAVFEAIRFAIENREKIIAICSMTHLGFQYWCSGVSDHERIIQSIIDEKFLFDTQDRNVKKALEIIKEEYQKMVEKAHKKMFIRARRSEFAKNRDHLMLALIQRDGFKCAECGTVDGLTIDHILPLSKGGSDDLDNLQLMCQTHNSKKGDRVAVCL